MQGSKYKSIKCTCDGFAFDSKLERDVYLALKALKAKGEISRIALQVPFALRAKDGATVGKYVADFTCVLSTGELIVVEAKGSETSLWKWKHKHFVADYPNIRLVVIFRRHIKTLSKMLVKSR